MMLLNSSKSKQNFTFVNPYLHCTMDETKVGAVVRRLRAARGLTLRTVAQRENQSRVVRANARQNLYSQWSRARIESLASGDLNRRLQAVLVTLKSDGSSGKRPYPAASGSWMASPLTRHSRRRCSCRLSLPCRRDNSKHFSDSQRWSAPASGLTCARSGVRAPHRPLPVLSVRLSACSFAEFTLSATKGSGQAARPAPCRFASFGKHSRASQTGYYFDI